MLLRQLVVLVDSGKLRRSQLDPLAAEKIDGVAVQYGA